MLSVTVVGKIFKSSTDFINTRLNGARKKSNCYVLTGEKLDDSGIMLEHSPPDSLSNLAQETATRVYCTSKKIISNA
jgi:hypothetical protein